MKVTITEQNINQHKSKIFPEIEEIKWELNYLDNEVLRNFPNLKDLDCSGNQLTDLQDIANLTQLRKLDCSGNQLTDLQDIANLTQLRRLYCSNNQLTNLQDIANLTRLRTLYCAYNQLTTLQGLANLKRLRELCCSRNELTRLQDIANLTQLQELSCSGNQLTNLHDLANLTQLQELYCFNNQLTNLQGLTNLTQLRTLNCSSNQITDLHPIIHLANITQLSYHSNPLNPLTIQEERFIIRLMAKPNSTVHNDKQKDHEPNKPDIAQLSIPLQNILQAFFRDKTLHSTLLITYEKLFFIVWSQIQQSPHKDMLICILEQELKNSIDLCFTGRFNRTVNILSGFHDDIVAQISDPKQIDAIIHQHKDPTRG